MMLTLKFMIIVGISAVATRATNLAGPPRVANMSNTVPRVDSKSGQIMDIHDGNILLVNGTFFWYGAGYGYCKEQTTGCANGTVGNCGFTLNHTVNLATSMYSMGQYDLFRTEYDSICGIGIIQ